MRLAAFLAAILLLATPSFAEAAPHPTPTPTDTPGSEGLNIKGVTVDIQPIELAPGVPASAPAGSHVEQPPAFSPFRAVPLGVQKLEPLRGFKASPKRARPTPTPTPAP